MQAGALGIARALLVVSAVWYFCFWLARRLKVDEEPSVVRAVPLVDVPTVAATKGTLGGLRTLWFALAFTCIGLETRVSDLLGMQGGRPAAAFVGAQAFNVAWTLALAFLLFGGVLVATPVFRSLELIVERSPNALVSFCWDGRVERVGSGTFRARATDLVPTRELTVFFFQPGGR